MAEDRLTLTGLRAMAHHGVFEHERADGQEFVIDVSVWLDSRGAAASDECRNRTNTTAAAIRSATP